MANAIDLNMDNGLVLEPKLLVEGAFPYRDFWFGIFVGFQ